MGMQGPGGAFAKSLGYMQEPGAICRTLVRCMWALQKYMKGSWCPGEEWRYMQGSGSMCKEAFRMSQDYSQLPQDGARYHQDGPTLPQDSQRWCQVGLKMFTNGLR